LLRRQQRSVCAFGGGRDKTLLLPASQKDEESRPRMNRIFNVLFLCTGNSARSILAEATLNKIGAGKFKAYSAGSFPNGTVNPNAIALLQRLHYRTEGLRSKSWSEFAGADAPQLDFVFTVCDNAANEPCPVWPGQPMTAHWGVPDPAAATGSHKDIEDAFKEAYRTLSRRIELFANLPVDKLDRMSLQRSLNEIGKDRASAST
jgi:arsenate reductase